MLQAYLKDVEGNAEGIAEQLTDKDLLACRNLAYEIGVLVKTAYPSLSPAIQDRYQELALQHHAGLVQRYGEEAYAAQETYDLLQPIPIIYRTRETQQFLDRWECSFGREPRQPRIVAQAGWVKAPVTVEHMLRLSPVALQRLLEHYDKVSVRLEWPDGGLAGGREELCGQLTLAASRMPLAYLGFAEQWWRDGLHEEYIVAAISGASDHLHYRFGNLSPPKGWTPGTPAPDGECIVSKILSILERYLSLWGNETAVARMLEGCAHAVTTFDNANRLTWLIIRLRSAKDPDFRNDTNKPRSHVDLLDESMNSARGIAAGGGMRLACRLTQEGLPLPDDADVAGDSWGRLMSLACLHGQIEMDAVFQELVSRDIESPWKGAAEVFASNLDKERIASLCRKGVLMILQRRPVLGSALEVIDRHLPDDAALEVTDVVGAIIAAYSEISSRVNLFRVFEWIARAANRNPAGTLPLIELLSRALEARRDELLLDSASLNAALLAILREADQSGDEALVRRALCLQDAYLRLNVDGIEKMLNAASRRD